MSAIVRITSRERNVISGAVAVFVVAGHLVFWWLDVNIWVAILVLLVTSTALLVGLVEMAAAWKARRR